MQSERGALSSRRAGGEEGSGSEEATRALCVAVQGVVSGQLEADNDAAYLGSASPPPLIGLAIRPKLSVLLRTGRFCSARRMSYPSPTTRSKERTSCLIQSLPDGL